MPRVSALRKKKKEVMLKARQCQKRKREESLMTACTPAAAAAASPSATPGSPAATRSPGAVIEVHTGLIVDYTVTSKICVHCKFHDAALRKKRITEEEYDRWKGSHDELCDINYEGTSGGMEAAAAVTMWTRSLEHNMRYMNFVCDGDSSAFRAVKECNNGDGPYGKDYVIEKWDCTNHVAKRLGTGLRNLRKDTYIEVNQSGSRKR
ncbi:hypothetical protein O3P69_012721, partial [Scylla paramamosain]